MCNGDVIVWLILLCLFRLLKIEQTMNEQLRSQFERMQVAPKHVQSISV
jgi:hypothetical protein